MSRMTDSADIPTETHPGIWQKAWEDTIESKWRKEFKKRLKHQTGSKMIYIRVTGFTERVQLESRGWEFDSLAASLYNARGNAFNMRIDRDKLEKYLVPATLAD